MRRLLMLLALVAAATPAVAGLIYNWEEDPQSAISAKGISAKGTIEFESGVVDYDDVDDVLGFSFVVGVPGSGGHAYVGKAFAFEALEGVEVGGEVLCFGSCPTSKAKKKAIKKGEFLRFTQKAPVGVLSWAGGYFTSQTTANPSGVFTLERGFGRWVQVPEPSALLLVLAGLGLAGLVRSRRSRR